MSLGSILLSEWVMNFLVGKLVGVTREGGGVSMFSNIDLWNHKNGCVHDDERAK
jgi:hypothetical protein